MPRRPTYTPEEIVERMRASAKARYLRKKAEREDEPRRPRGRPRKYSTPEEAKRKHTEINVKWRKEHPDKVREYAKKYRNGPRNRAFALAHYYRHHEEMKEKNRLAYHMRKAKIAQAKKEQAAEQVSTQPIEPIIPIERA